MPRGKKTGSIIKRTERDENGKAARTFYEARRRFTDREGHRREKKRRVETYAAALDAARQILMEIEVEKVAATAKAEYERALAIVKAAVYSPPIPFTKAEAVIAAAKVARSVDLLAELETCKPRIRQAKKLAKLNQHAEDWRKKVAAVFPDLTPAVIELLPDEKPYMIAFEQVGQTALGVSGRQLQRILADQPGNVATKTDDKNGRH
jgi:hypothetical protein